MSELISVAIIGAGGRGRGFAELVQNSGGSNLGVVAGVAEPRAEARMEIAARYRLPAERVFNCWEEFVAQPKLCDAVIISTMDRDHVGPALACLAHGYHVLLEKPMATTLEDCRAIEAAQRRAGTIVAVCHSLRYHKGFALVKEILDSGRLGQLITLDQLEQVGYWHQAHSFVRGNWGNADRSTFMLLAKSCHDLDYIAYLVGRPCRRVSSFGALSYFTRAHAPAGSTERCTDGCAVEHECPYSAIKTYVDAERLDAWPACVPSFVHTREAHLDAIRSGPYGRCVFRTDNDVVDHQVVLLDFADDITATFTMTGFTQELARKIRLHGSEAELSFDEHTITIKTFATHNIEQITLGQEPGGHGGGDWRVVTDWLRAIQRHDPTLVRTSAQESLRTHTIAFAAEQSRREQRMVEICEE